MIRTFRSKPFRAYFETGNARGLSMKNTERARRILLALDAATRPEQMNLPGYFFHGLHGVGRWSVRVSGN